MTYIAFSNLLASAKLGGGITRLLVEQLLEGDRHGYQDVRSRASPVHDDPNIIALANHEFTFSPPTIALIRKSFHRVLGDFTTICRGISRQGLEEVDREARGVFVIHQDLRAELREALPTAPVQDAIQNSYALLNLWFTESGLERFIVYSIPFHSESRCPWGGVYFLFQKDPENSVTGDLRDLLAMLVREIFLQCYWECLAQSDIVAKMQDSIVHLAVNALLTSRAELLIRRLAGTVPAKQLKPPVLALKDTLLDNDGVPYREFERGLCGLLNSVHVAETRTKAALRWLRVLTCAAGIPPNFRASKDYALVNIVDEAWRMLRAYEYADTRRSSSSPLLPDAVPYVESSESASDILLPAGFYQGDMLAGLLYELLINAHKHSSDRFSIRVGVGRAAGDAIDIIVLSALDPSDATEWAIFKTFAIPCGRKADLERYGSFLTHITDLIRPGAFGIGLASSLKPASGPPSQYEARMTLLPTSIVKDPRYD